MDPCEALRDWEELSPEQKAELLGQYVTDLLTQMGYDPVRVELQEILDPQGRPAYYNDEEKAIFLDRTSLIRRAGINSFGTAAHEAFHAIQDQVGTLDEEYAEGLSEVGPNEMRALEMQRLEEDCGKEDLVESAADLDLPDEGDEGGWASEEMQEIAGITGGEGDSEYE